MNRFLKTALLFAFLMLSLLPFNVRAQQDINFRNMQVDLWPEYDQPSMLVILRGSLSSDVRLPTDLTFRIPADAGEPNAVAVTDESGSPFTVAYTREVRGEWALITFTATLPGIQLEYYDPDLEKEGDQRQFEYHWSGDYSVESLLVLVQQPLGATDMQIVPRLGVVSQESDGLVYYGSEIGSLRAGESFDLTVEYQKVSDSLTVGNLSVQPSAPITADTPGRVNIPGLIPWVLGVLGVGLIAGGVYWYWSTERRKTSSPPRRRSRPISASQETVENGVFCHNCGKRAAAGDRYCRACGTRLRSE